MKRLIKPFKQFPCTTSLKGFFGRSQICSATTYCHTPVPNHLKNNLFKQTISGRGMMAANRPVRRSIPDDAFHMLTGLFVIGRLDHCNATLVGIPMNLLRRVLSTAARTVKDWSGSTRICSSLVSLHWLRTTERIASSRPFCCFGVCTMRLCASLIIDSANRQYALSKAALIIE